MNKVIICYRLADRQLLGELNVDHKYLKSLISNPIWKENKFGTNSEESAGWEVKETVTKIAPK
jgi:hypothetical protein